MSVNSLNDFSILKLFNLSKQCVETFHVRYHESEVIVSVKLSEQNEKCPLCQNSKKVIKDYRLKKINHSTLINTKCTIEYRARRYRCTACSKSYYEKNPFTFDGMKISLLTVYNVLNDLKSSNLTFSDVAKRHDISSTTVVNIFDKHVNLSRLTLPKILCIDEVYAFKSNDSNYVCVLVDFIHQTTIDILPSRKKDDLIKYFSLIPREERLKVEIVSIDMWETYRSVTQILFPNAVNAVDKFHVLQEFTRHLTKTRIQAMKSVTNNPDVNPKEMNATDRFTYYKDKKSYYVFKKFNWLLMNKDETLTDVNHEKRFNHVLNRYCNYYDLLQIMLESSPDLCEVYNFKNRLDRFYKKKESNSLKSELEGLINSCKKSNLKCMNDFGNTLIRWKNEILHSFKEIEETKTKVNNAIIENRNKVIKTIKRHSNGYSNWNRFRNRVLYVTNPESSYSMYPNNKKAESQ